MQTESAHSPHSMLFPSKLKIQWRWEVGCWHPEWCTARAMYD